MDLLNNNINNNNSNNNSGLPDQSQRRNNKLFPFKNIVIILTIVTVGIFILFAVRYFWQSKLPFSSISLNPFKWSGTQVAAVERFNSEEDFKNYLARAGELSGDTGQFETLRAPALPLEEGFNRQVDFGVNALASGQEAKVMADQPGRVSETNVQVVDIDEPDIVKTNGREIFASLGYFYYPLPQPGIDLRENVDTGSGVIVKDTKIVEGDYPYRPREARQPGVRAIKAWPPADLAVEGTIFQQGNLLLNDDKLIIFSDKKIYGYKVSDPKKPQQTWEINLKGNNYLVTSRLYGGELYLISRTRINYPRPCPFELMSADSEDITIPCTNIYHPMVTTEVDSTYTISKVDPETGKIVATVSFLGSQNYSTVYMSENNIYLTYFYPGDVVGYVIDFFSANSDLFNQEVVDRLQKLKGYELRQQTKMSELSYILNNYQQRLDADKRLRLKNELENKLKEFNQTYLRKLEQTGIVKIDNKKLKITATGSVPGRLLNQFSLDEYENNLRLATTLSGGRWRFGILPQGESANDVYVLNSKLKMVGQLLDLGLTERVYSARFVGDQGYVVTFRQTDPFYVINLKDPKKPQLAGELKIPGYSSYLHPLSKTLLVGIGKESSKVKVSLFDVSDPGSPREVAKYTLDEYWSEVLSTHHAFLADPDNLTFFLPGSKGGYIFSYKDNNLELMKAVSGIKAKRAIYLDNYFYIIGDDQLVVLNQSDWQRVNEISY